MLQPKLISTLKNYSLAQFHADFIAGIIVGVVALPLAIAFAIASGVTPDRGLVTAIVAGFLISALGGSRVQIGGPTGAFVIIVYGIVQKHGMDGLLVATFMGGIILLIMGFARFGGVIKFVPYPVTIGFTSGIALIIFTSQIKDFFGFSIAHIPTEFLGRWMAYGEHLNTLDPWTLAIGLVTIFTIWGWQKLTKTIPGSIVALILTTVLVQHFKLPVETIGSRFGGIPHTLPIPQLPHLSWGLIQTLLPSAVTIAILAGVESLLSAVVSDGMIGGKHRSNMELVAQGIANIVSSLFGGMPATGAIARTVTNVHNGGRTPVAGMVHAATLFLIMFLFAKWAALIPLSAFAGILIMVAYRMSEWHSFAMVLKAPRSDAVVLLITFILTVTIDLTIAIEIGMALAAFLFMHQLSLTADMGVITRELADEEERDDPNAVSKKEIPKEVEIFEINGPFFFGIASTFVETISRIERKPKVRILRMRHVPTIDATALNALRQVFRGSRKNGINFLLSGVRHQPMKALEESGLMGEIGAENVFTNLDGALSRAKNILIS